MQDEYIDTNDSVEDQLNPDGSSVNETLQADPRLVELLQSDDLTAAKLETFRVLIDPFQEQGQLMDPILRSMVAPVILRIQKIIKVASAVNSSSAAFPFQVLQDEQRTELHLSCQVLYLLCKVRGYKTIVKLLPHDVSEFEPVLLLLQSQDRDDFTTWEIRYILLLWLSILALVPFDLKSIDSSMDGNEDSAETIAIVANIITICKNYLQDSGSTQQAAALCLARLLSRPDMEEQYLKMFLNYVKHEFDAFSSSHVIDQSPAQARVRQYKITGIMLCLSYICKFTPRDKHIILMGDYFGHVMNVLETIRILDAEVVISSTLHRKLSTKLLQRMGLLFLPPKVMAWRYSRGLRSLEANLNLKAAETPMPMKEFQIDDDIEVPEELEQVVDVLLCGLRDRDTIVRWSAAKGIGRITARLPFEFADDIVQSVLLLFSPSESDAAWHGASLAIAELSRRCVLLPERLPEAVSAVSSALMYDVRRGAHSIGAHVRDAACYACWSFARAYEPSLFLPYLQQTLAPIMLTVCAFDRELNCRRAAAAAFQESVGRQGVGNFPHGIDLLTKADYFTLASMSHAFLDVSQHIAKYAEYRYALMNHLVSVKVFHWDTNVRALAASALGLLAPLDVSFTISSIIPPLLSASISSSSDVIVRHGATLALSEIALQISSVPAFIDGEVMRRLKVVPIEMDKRRLYRGRGGEMIRVAVCQLIQTISTLGWPLALAIMKKYLSTLEECIKHPNEAVRNSAIEAYESMANRYLTKLVGVYENKLYVDAIVPRFLACVKEKDVLNPNVATRRGFLRALGVTPFELLQGHIDVCVNLMVTAAVLSLHTADEQDAESRVAAIQSLVDLSTKLKPHISTEFLSRILEALLQCANEDYGVDERGDVGSWVRKEAMLGIQQLLLLHAIPSTKSDHPRQVNVKSFGNGEVVETRYFKRQLVYVQFDKKSLGYFYFAPNGIGVFNAERIVDLHDSAGLLPALGQRCEVKLSPDKINAAVSPIIVTKFCCVLVKQMSEKLDSIRFVAGSIFSQLFHYTTIIDGIPDRPLLSKLLLPTINWSMAHDTFPLVIQLLDSPVYMEAVVEGLVVSVGGLTESVVKASKNALLVWLKEQLKTNHLQVASKFAHYCVSLFQTHAKDDRVIIPLMKTIAYCLEERTFDFLHKDGPIFGNALYDAVSSEISKTSDLHKISAGLAVLVGLLPSEASVEKRTFRGICVCLGHRFPKVRKMTAEKLYTRLILQDDLVEESKYDEVLSTLSETAWDADMVHARLKRNQLIELLGLEKIEKRAPTGGPMKVAKDSSEGENSYKSLVKEMGY
ncbi:Aste57867_8357 [Aphanomyces stellatus]|uniref:Aste57867_8357 protein n=1 Tax=Aphanomyces stellatus TaxID=120398 RepID=A0A485KK15_9STRA|nr:hypothetical protein As57867_008325 [Aphanomyces stellatus]VFT85243.1 Aste57867_8357 [Aphanomyces stellatus]